MKYTEEERLAFARTRGAIWPDNEIALDAVIDDSAVIGGDGFGWIRDEQMNLVRMPHRGNVVIERWVNIGACTCIDRAVEGSTVIGEGTKIDNLCHLAHGCKIGKHVLVIAGTIVGGSAEVGDYSYLGMGCMIKNKVKVGKNCIIGAGAVILKDVPDNEVWVGNPGKFLRKNV